jgi:hypothetical protein
MWTDKALSSLVQLRPEVCVPCLLRHNTSFTAANEFRIRASVGNAGTLWQDDRSRSESLFARPGEVLGNDMDTGHHAIKCRRDLHFDFVL